MSTSKANFLNWSPPSMNSLHSEFEYTWVFSIHTHKTNQERHTCIIVFWLYHSYPSVSCRSWQSSDSILPSSTQRERERERERESHNKSRPSLPPRKIRSEGSTHLSTKRGEAQAHCFFFPLLYLLEEHEQNKTQASCITRYSFCFFGLFMFDIS